jgi:hypothetical protein
MNSAAERILSEGVGFFRRPTSISEILAPFLDARFAAAGANAAQFALAMSDCAQAHKLRSDGVLLALCAARSGDQRYIEHCLRILREANRWSPLQRPGWTAYSATITVPAGGDGVWLATAWGTSGIIDMLQILGDHVPIELRTSLNEQLRSEVRRIVADWADQRPWYVRSRAAQSNQWIEPSVALVKACLYLGDPSLRDAYDLGVENIGRSLNRLGSDGAFPEGVSYAAMTFEPLFDCLANLRANGDFRCHATGFARNAWSWFAQMMMPGAKFVNCDDSGMSSVPTWARSTPLPGMVAAVLGSDEPGAIRAMSRLFPRGNTSLHGVKYQIALDESSQHTPASLPTFAYFPSRHLLVWRSAWEGPADAQQALGLWFKGGSINDAHCHRDQGHLSVYAGDRPVLIEAGTPNYATPWFDRDYASARGHGIMQVGEVAPRSLPVEAPMTVHQLDESGGSASVDCSRAYMGAKCIRRVTWNAPGLIEIRDTTSFDRVVPAGTEIYRFHTGSIDTLTIAPIDGGWSVTWPDASIRLSADSPVVVEQASWPDAVTPRGVHQAVIVKTGTPRHNFNMDTAIRVRHQASERSVSAGQ